MRLFLNIYDFLHQRRGLFFTLLAAFVGMLLLMLTSLRYNEDIYDFLPLSDKQQKAITLYQDISGGKRVVAMFRMRDEKVRNTDRLVEAVDTFAQRLQTGSGNRHVRELTTQVDFEKYAGIADFVYHNLPLMLADSDYVRMERLLANPSHVDESLANDVQMIMMPATGFFATNIGNDPLELFTPVMQRLQQRQKTLPFDVDDGYVFTSDHQYAIVMMTSSYGAMESANNALLVNYVDSVCQETMKALPDVEVAITGSPVIAVGNAKQIKEDSRWAVLISVVLIFLLLVYFFRSARNLMLIGLSILIGWLFAMGFIAVLRTNVSLIVLGIGSIIIGIAVNYPLHFVAHNVDHGGNRREVLKDMIPPLLIGNVTTVGAFASLVPLDAPALRDLGLFAAFMLIGTILFVLIFLPHLVKEHGSVEERERSNEGTRERGNEGTRERDYIKTHLKLSSLPRSLASLLLILITIFLGYFSFKTSFDANMHHVNYMTPLQERLMADLHVSAGVNDTSNVYVVAEGDTWEEALKERSKLNSVLDSMKRAGELKQYSDFTSFVCSKEEQMARIQKWNAFWQGHREEVLRLLRTKAPSYGFSDDAFDGFLDIVSADYTTKSFNDFEPLLSVLFSNSYSSSTGRCSIVDIADVGKGEVETVENEVNDAVEDHGYAFDFVGMNSAVARSLSNDFNYIGFACGFIVFLFLWLSFGRLELSMLAFCPMALGWIWILGMMYLFGMQFNIVNVILATFIFGQGDDYTIFMTDGLINEYAYRKKLLPSYKRSIIISALIMFIGMGSLIIAKHPALYSLAQVTIVGMFTVVLMAWVVPPMIFYWLVRSEGQIRRVPVTLQQIVTTTYCSVVYLSELAYGCLFGIVARLLPIRKERREAFMQSLVYKTMRANITHIWGVRSVISNPHGEDFSRGSVTICNHQSILDPIYMLALSPKVKVMISGKVWKNPIVNPLFRLAGFLNLDKPVEQLKETVAKAVAKGYNVVIFPEGRRNDEAISRFHKGAFYIAGEIEADILQVYIHGAGDVMPRGCAMAARGRIDVEIGERIPASRLKEFGDNYQTITQTFCHNYQEYYEDMKRRIRTSHYYHDYIIYKYTYKGIGIEKETRRLLRKHDDFSELIDAPLNGITEKHFHDAGRGQLAMLFALVHPEVEVYAHCFDPDDVALLASMSPMPRNLHVSDASL